VRHHHENWDGSGYPDGLSEEAIPLESRIIMFADTIDAMTSDRPYRAALGEADVRAELIRMKGRQFDPEICDALLSSTLFPLLFAPKGPVLETTGVSAPRRIAALAGAS
jgi:HD-GYP domain-containing protein (c-di-GMP phosphodiesterase class II)